MRLLSRECSPTESYHQMCRALPAPTSVIFNSNWLTSMFIFERSPAKFNYWLNLVQEPNPIRSYQAVYICFWQATITHTWVGLLFLCVCVFSPLAINALCVSIDTVRCASLIRSNSQSHRFVRFGGAGWTKGDSISWCGSERQTQNLTTIKTTKYIEKEIETWQTRIFIYFFFFQCWTKNN